MHGCDNAISIQTGIVTGENNGPLPRHRGWALCSLLSPSSTLKGRKLLRTCAGPVFRTSLQAAPAQPPLRTHWGPPCPCPCHRPQQQHIPPALSLPHYPPPFQHLLVIHNTDSSTAPPHTGHLSHDPPPPPTTSTQNPKELKPEHKAARISPQTYQISPLTRHSSSGWEVVSSSGSLYCPGSVPCEQAAAAASPVLPLLPPRWVKAAPSCAAVCIPERVWVQPRQEQLLSLSWGDGLHCSAHLAFCQCSKIKFVKLVLVFGLWVAVISPASCPEHADINGAHTGVKHSSSINTKF